MQDNMNQLKDSVGVSLSPFGEMLKQALENSPSEEDIKERLETSPLVRSSEKGSADKE